MFWVGRGRVAPDAMSRVGRAQAVQGLTVMKGIGVSVKSNEKFFWRIAWFYFHFAKTPMDTDWRWARGKEGDQRGCCSHSGRKDVCATTTNSNNSPPGKLCNVAFIANHQYAEQCLA